MDRAQLIEELHSFAHTLEVTYKGDRRSWASHASVDRNHGRGFTDEETHVQPRVFPAFAKRFLGWTVGTDLAAETTDVAGKPDFTPDDRVTHRFVFETKGTAEQDALPGHDKQIKNYLSANVTDVVVLTNMIAVRVLRLDSNGEIVEDYAFSLRGLWATDLDQAVDLPDAAKFEQFVAEFSRQELTTDQKIDRIRSAPPWTDLEQTTPGWLKTRVARVVDIFQAEVRSLVAQGELTAPATLVASERSAVLDEIRGLLVRFNVPIEEAEQETLDSILSSKADTHVAAREQFIAHVAYWITTKLVLVRVWEDLGLVNPATLYDGGFDKAMTMFDDNVERVIRGAFSLGRERYRALFVDQSSYSWYSPSRETAVDGLYELANTYMGGVTSDVLGEVYETMLQRIDRKLLGQYYTPRDVIAAMWDLVATDDLRATADAQQRVLRTIDIATGSGGFLVEGVSRERQRFEAASSAGAALSAQEWLSRVAEGYVGVEFQRFSAFLAELNILIQLSPVLATSSDLRSPELGILNADTLTLHQPVLLDNVAAAAEDSNVYALGDSSRPSLTRRVKDPDGNAHWFDVAVGNPPYIGEKGGAAELLRRVESRHPYWDDFKAAHRDYLYGFLIVGISKLRPGGRFAFITTEYWLRATGAAPLRKYLAAHCDIERLILFRDMRLFPDAPGQENLIVVGTRRTDDNDPSAAPSGTRPRVSIYEGDNLGIDDRKDALEALRDGTSAAQVRSFEAAASPNDVAGEPWIEVSLSKAQAAKRRKVLELDQLSSIKATEGAIVTAQKVNAYLVKKMTRDELAATPKGTSLFELSPDEVDALGALNDAEKSAVRRVIGPRDVYPYAAVLPDDQPYWIVLPQPDDISNELTREQIIQIPFDDVAMPNIAAHLNRFKPILTRHLIAGSDSRYDRPWWTAHQSQQHATGTAPAGSDWGTYCVTSRWGGGGSLVVGLAPANAVPKSSLHILYATDGSDGRHAAYLCGIYNSDLYQQLGDTFAPGNTRAGEIEALGLPDIDATARTAIESSVYALADLMTETMSTGGLGDAYPELGPLLMDSVHLLDTPTGWCPRPGPSSTWGTVESVQWLSISDKQGPQAKPVTGAEFDETLFGPVLRFLHESPTASSRLTLLIEGDHVPHPDEQSMLLSWAHGLDVEGVHLRDVGDQPMPISLGELHSQHNSDRANLDAFVHAYRSHRQDIERELTG